VVVGSTTVASRAVSVKKESTTTESGKPAMTRAVCSESGSMTTGLPLVTHSARAGGSRRASMSCPSSGSRTVRGGGCGCANDRSNAPRRRK
jgi:hypothetical protein